MYGKRVKKRNIHVFGGDISWKNGVGELENKIGAPYFMVLPDRCFILEIETVDENLAIIIFETLPETLFISII